jgi:hypothetical protein
MGKFLEPPIANESAARLVADSAVAMWASIFAALSPVIGQCGSGTLYKRSLRLALADYSWLAEAYEGAVQAGDFTSLHVALSQQTGACAGSAHKAMLQTFHHVLGDLIGRSLMDRLLQGARDSHRDTQAAM